MWEKSKKIDDDKSQEKGVTSYGFLAASKTEGHVPKKTGQQPSF